MKLTYSYISVRKGQYDTLLLGITNIPPLHCPPLSPQVVTISVCQFLIVARVVCCVAIILAVSAFALPDLESFISRWRSGVRNKARNSGSYTDLQSWYLSFRKTLNVVESMLKKATCAYRVTAEDLVPVGPMRPVRPTIPFPVLNLLRHSVHFNISFRIPRVRVFWPAFSASTRIPSGSLPSTCTSSCCSTAPSRPWSLRPRMTTRQYRPYRY